MKNIKKYIIVVAILFVCNPILQSQSYYHNEFTVSLGLGSSALKYQIKNQENSKSGFGWQLGAGYSHYFNRMFGISLGLEAAGFSSSIEIPALSFDQRIQTPPGLSGNFSLKANYDGLKESQTATFLQIPVMLQFQFPIDKKDFFFLGAGLKAGFPVSSKWNQDITKLTTTGYSDFANQQLTDMPNHGFSTYSNSSASGKLKIKSPVFLALEGGLKFGIGQGKSLYAGLFLDYGLSDIYKAPAANTSLLVYNNDSPADYIHNSVLAANQFSVINGIKPFAVGVKFKLGFGMGKTIKPAPKAVVPKDKEQKPEPVWGWE